MKAPMAGGSSVVLTVFYVGFFTLVLLINDCFGVGTLARTVADATIRPQPITLPTD